MSFALAAGMTATAVPAAARQGAYCGVSSAGARVFTGNDNTTCGFALNTAERFHANGPGTFSVTSPATGTTYMMSCSGRGECTGGNNAYVQVGP